MRKPEVPDLLFFFESVLETVGKALLIVLPALKAKSTRKSWISCRSGVFSEPAIFFRFSIGYLGRIRTIKQIAGVALLHLGCVAGKLV